MTPKIDEAPLSLQELVETLRDGRWLLVGCLAASLAVGLVSIPLREPVYRADGLVQIEDRSKALDPLRDQATAYQVDTPTEAEVDLIRSRSVAMEVIRAHQLDIAVRPMRAPFIGALFAGGEKLQIDTLDVDPALANRTLTLVARGGRAFTLSGPDGKPLVDGEVGSQASSSRASILVSELTAKPGARFAVVKQPASEALERFLSQLTVTERGRDTGVISLELRGPRPDQVQAALASVMDAYIRRDVEHRTRATERRLEFVNSQLPVLKDNLDQAELRLKQYRTQTGQLDIGLESKAIVDRGVDLDAQITKLKLELFEVRQRFTESHPSYVSLSEKLKQLAKARQKLDAATEARPDTELSWVRLTRDVKVASDLYLQLLTKAQELAVWKAANIGGVRLVDPAMVRRRPIAPDVPATLIMSLIVGVALGLGWTLARQGLRRGVHSAQAIEQHLRLPVYACLPKSRWRGGRRTTAPLARSAPDDPCVETLRSLRARLAHELPSAPNRILLLTASRPHVGRAFVATNLAVLFASTGRKVLLVDADLRKGPLRHAFPQAHVAGLAELVERGGAAEALDDFMSPTDSPNLHVLTSGALPLEPSELLSRPAFTQVLTAATKRFDLVLCIAPPVLSVSDACIVAQAAGTTLLVAKANEHSINELSLAVSRLANCGARPRGFVINVVPLHEARREARFHARFEYR